MKETDIRPSNLHNEYIRLSALDAANIFSSGIRTKVSCPGCKTAEQKKAFVKFDFDYVECPSCGSLYQSPRPADSDFESFYLNSISAEFWAKKFFPAVAESRRSLIFRPRAKRVFELCNKYQISIKQLIDVGAGYGLFLEEWHKISPNSKLKGIEPGADLAAICRKKEIEILQSTSEKADLWKNSAELVTCFEVFEHVYNPFAFVTSLYNLAKTDGLVVMTTLGVDGFDIQTLWSESKSISPPHHINFLSVAGLEILFKRVGFRSIEVFTPGELDVDIVLNYVKDHPEFQVPPFFKKMMVRGEPALQNFQNFLSANQLSSHTWVVAKK